MALVGCLVAVGLLAAPAAVPEAPPRAQVQVIAEGPALQLNGSQFVVHSPSVGRNFLVKVTPPFSPIPAGQTRPVIYALDGGYEVAGPMAWVLGGSGGMSQAWVVSVGYQPADYHWRETDLAHVPIVERNGVASGAGGAAFETFLTQELAPFIASRFAVDNGQAILFGHSRGGLFAARVFAEHPQAFRGYIIGSADIRHDPAVVDFVRAAAPHAAGVRVSVAAGGAEDPAVLQDEKALAAALTGPGSGAIVRSQIYEGATHLSYYPRLITDAFPWVLPPETRR